MCEKLVSLSALIFLLALLLPGPANAQDPNLVGWWQFEEESGTLYDQSDYQNDGTSFNGVLYQQTGRVGYALGFDGTDDYVVVGSAGRPTDTFSFGGWMKTSVTHEVEAETVSGAGGVANQRYAFDPQHGGDFNGGAGLSVGTNGISVYEHGSNYMPATAVYSAEIGTDWNHIMIVYDNKQPTIYLNGQAVRTGLTSPREVVNAPIQIGGMAYGYFSGLMDEVRIYDRVLSAAEVQELAAWPEAHNPDPPDGAQGITAPLVRWTPGDSAVWHDVYFGTTPDLGPDDFQMRNQKSMTLYYHLAGLTPGVTYYWRIDEIEADEVTIHTGDVWSFTAMPLTAWAPDPADGAEDVLLDPLLTWSPGQTASEHHVYFADNFGDVNDGAASADKGAVEDASYEPGTLEVETTYYWRVDEEDGDGTIHTGDVWSFTTVGRGPGKIIREWWLGMSGTELNTLKDNPRYPDDPDGSEFVDLFEGPVDWADNYGSRVRGWLYPPQSADYTFWIATDDFGELWLSADEDPANAVLIASVPGWVPSRDFDNTGGGVGGPEQKSNPIALEAGKRYYVEGLMKEGGGGDNIAVAWQGGPILSREVLSGDYVGATPYPPVKAYGPVPVDGATDVPDTATLRWSAGTYAAKHDVYFGADPDAVANADTTTTAIYRGRQNTAGYAPGTLQWDTTYYWRIDEVNDLHPDSPWPGSVWSFTTANFMIVEGFEDYNDFTPDRIWQTWRDGVGYNEPPPGYAGNGTGSQVGNDDSPFTEQTIVHGGGQAMTFRYTNDGSTGKALYSETERQWAAPQDWTRKGVKALTLWFNGDPANSPEPLYVGLQDGLGTRKDVPHENTNAVRVDGWQEWNIDLQEFAHAGVNLTRVKKMYIGVGNRLSPQTGGTGRLYFDDIRLYPPRCLPGKAQPDAELSGDCIVDYADLQIVADQWLSSGYLITPADPATNGLAGHWRFDGNVNDSSGNGHHGTISGSPTYMAGRVGQAINFDGVDDYVTVGSIGISGSVPRTIAGWAKATSTDIPNWTTVFGFSNDLTAEQAGTYFDIQRRNYGAYAIHVYGWERDLADVDFDWHHLAATYDGEIIRWYAEGRLVNSEAWTISTLDNVMMGKRGDRESYFPGLVDDVRIYNRALSDAEIAFLAGETVPFSEPFDLNVDDTVDFKDYTILMDGWLDEVLWP